MAIETIPIGAIWGFLRWLPGFLVRWYFPPEKLAKLIYVDLCPRGDSAIVNLGQIASFNLNIQVINLSPFSIELDRANFQFFYGGAVLNTAILKRQTIASGEIVTLYLSEAIPDGHANQMARFGMNNPTAFDGNIEFNCKVRQFAKRVGHLDGINVKVYNALARADA